MGCDAILSRGAIEELTRKHGQDAVSHDNSWLPTTAAVPPNYEESAEETPPSYAEAEEETPLNYEEGARNGQ
jgi:hypothetical protein